MELSAILDDLWPKAQTLFSGRHFDGAKAVCEAILTRAPLDSRAHLMLANIASQQGKQRLASEHSLAAAAKMGRQSLQHVAAVALKLISVGEYQASVNLIRKIDPAATPAPSSLAEFSQQLSLLEQHQDALRYLDAAIGAGLETDWARYLRGNTLKFLGRLDEAAEEYEKSLAINPVYCYAHHALAYLDVGGHFERRIDRLNRALGNTRINSQERVYLHYALFKELDGVGDTVRAWQALEAGHKGKRHSIEFDPREETVLFDLMIDTCGPSPAYSASTDDRQKTPIFIVGMPRTGTTLLERILGGHPEMTLCGELNDFPMQYKWQIDHAFSGFLDRTAIARLASADFAQLGHRYLEHVAWRVPRTAFFTDKNPGNFMLLGAIMRALPGARIIHLRRNPMDSCFSNLKELFAANAHAYSYDLSDLANHYRNYSKLMRHWHTVAPGRILDVDYEDLVLDPETTTRRMMEYCGLPYQAQQTRIEANTAPVSTASSAQVRQPIHANNIGNWKHYATQLAPLHAMLEDMIGG